MKNNKRLQDQTAIVTGAGSGIGKAIAIEMAGEGANVVVNYIADADDAQKVADAAKDAGGEAIIFKADVSKEDQVKEMFSKAIETFGRLDILVNNAGIQIDDAID